MIAAVDLPCPTWCTRCSTTTGGAHVRVTFNPKTGRELSFTVVYRPEFVTNACLLLHR